MSMVDPSARIEAGAKIGEDTSIGPFCVVGPDVVLGEGCRLLAHVHLTGHTVIGPRTVIYPFASLGTPPQSVKYRGGPTRLVIGADCDIRENVTMNIGTEDGGGVTLVGDRCFFMAGSHVGHDCRVGDDVIFANNAVLGGHVTVGDRVFLGGQAAVHQFVRIGESAMLGGMSGISRDVIPFGFAFGTRAELVGLNVVGLKRRGHTRAEMHGLRRCYRTLFLGTGEFRDRIETAAAQHADDPLARKMIEFLRGGRLRAVMMAAPRKRSINGSDAEPSHE
jgi:UDP-N-acetylglucosamine acyltransferase